MIRNQMIPFSDPSASYLAHKKSEIDQAIQRVLDSGWFVLGKEVDAFEKEFAAFHGEDFHAVGVANGTDAIALCLRGLGLGTGDEVITPSHTAVATVAGIEQAGCTPVFADIDPNTRCIDPIQLRKEWVPVQEQSCRFTFMDNRLKCTGSWRLPKPTIWLWLRIVRRHMERRSMDKKWAPSRIIPHTVATLPKTWAEREMAG